MSKAVFTSDDCDVKAPYECYEHAIGSYQMLKLSLENDTVHSRIQLLNFDPLCEKVQIIRIMKYSNPILNA